MVYLTEHCGFSDFEHNRDKITVFFSFFFFSCIVSLCVWGGGMGGGRWEVVGFKLYTVYMSCLQ